MSLQPTSLQRPVANGKKVQWNQQNYFINELF